MLPVAAAVLVWNELGAVERNRALQEGSATHVTSTGSDLDPANEGLLIHLVAMAETDETLMDEDFSVEAKGALRLIRNVEMFQWRERPDDRGELPLGGGEPGSGPSYFGEWSGQLIDSSRFQLAAIYTNPDSFPYPSTDWPARNARMGAFELSTGFIARIGGSERLRHDPEAIRNSTDAQAPFSGIRVTPEGFLFLGAGTPAEPQIGDIQVEHRVVPPQMLTVVAAQRGRTFDTYTAANGEQLFYVMSGEKSVDQVFKQAEQGNRLMFWSMRGGGVLLFFIGLCTILRPALLLARFKPLAWRMVGNLAGAPALLLSLAFSAAVVSLVWVPYRPIAGLSILAASLALGILADRIGLRHRGRMIRSFSRRERA